MPKLYMQCRGTCPNYTYNAWAVHTALTGIFPYKYPVFAFYTGFINLGRNRRVDKKIAPNCSFPTHVLLCVLLLKNYKNNDTTFPRQRLS